MIEQLIRWEFTARQFAHLRSMCKKTETGACCTMRCHIIDQPATNVAYHITTIEMPSPDHQRPKVLEIFVWIFFISQPSRKVGNEIADVEIFENIK